MGSAIVAFPSALLSPQSPILPGRSSGLALLENLFSFNSPPL